jgi:hypothetical protein
MHSVTVSSYYGMDKRETIVAWWTMWCDELPIWCSFMNCPLLSHACQRAGEPRKPSAAAFQRESSRCQVTEHERVSAFKVGDPLSLPLLAAASSCWDPMLAIACVPLHAPSSSQILYGFGRRLHVGVHCDDADCSVFLNGSFRGLNWSSIHYEYAPGRASDPVWPSAVTSSHNTQLLTESDRDSTGIRRDEPGFGCLVLP